MLTTPNIVLRFTQHSELKNINIQTELRGHPNRIHYHVLMKGKLNEFMESTTTKTKEKA
jgi:hypothetical protein